MTLDTGSVATPPPTDSAMLDEQLPLLPGLRSEDQPARGLVTLAIADLVLDGALQCRTATSPETIAAYAELLREGATFPAVRVVRVDGKLLVVDGWHRVRAHVQVGRANIEATVEDGDRWAATVAAAGANASHGLQRTQDDKRRAVRVLLADETGAGLASRQLAKLAGVSHTFVDELRKKYSVKQGQVVTDKRIEQVDGEPSGEWKRIVDECASEGAHVKSVVMAHRAISNLQALYAQGVPYSKHGARAYHLRERELAADPWPWADDTDELYRAARAKGLDTKEDILKALGSCDLPPECREGLQQALKDVTATDKYLLPEISRRHKDTRPAIAKRAETIVAKAKAAEAERAANKPAQPYDLAQDIRGMDPATQDKAVAVCSAEVLRYLKPSGLSPRARDGAFRTRVAGAVTKRCPNPACGGWIWQESSWVTPSCAWCDANERDWAPEMRAALKATAEIMSVEGYGFEVKGIVVDRTAIRLLRALTDARVNDPNEFAKWTMKAPQLLHGEIMGFLQPREPVRFTQHEPVEPKAATEVEAEEDEEFGEDDVDDLADDEGGDE